MQSPTDSIQLVIGIFAVLGVLWQLAQVKASIDKAIDAVKDEAYDWHSELDKRLDIHLRDYDNYCRVSEEKYRILYNSMRDMEKIVRESNPNYRVRQYFSDESGTLEPPPSPPLR